MTVLYTLLFILLMLGDWSQGSLNGGIWAITVNCTGLIICILISSLLQWKRPLERIYFIWLGIWFIGSIIAYGIWKRDVTHVLDGQFITALLNVGYIGVLVLKYWKDGFFRDYFAGKFRQNVLLRYLWIALTVWMCFSPRRSVWHIWFFILFSMFYMLPLSEIQKTKIKNGILNGVIWGFFVLQIYAYGFRPYDEVRYKGSYANCNNNALMYLVVYIVVLVRILVWERQPKSITKKIWLLFYYVLAGGLLGFQVLTMTRTALIMDVMVTLVFLIFVLVRELKDQKKLFAAFWGVIGRGVLVFSLMVITFPLVFGTVRYLPTILHHPVWYSNEGYSIEKVHSFDSWNSEKYVSFEEFIDTFCERFSIEHPLIVRAETGNEMAEMQDISEVMSEIPESGAIRLKIYRIYLENMNWFGHTAKEGFFRITDDYYSYHAHNIFIQMAFTYGLPAGIMLILLAAVMGISILVKWIRNPYDNWIAFSGFVYLVFFGYGMLEMTWNTGQMILVLLFFTQRSLERMGSIKKGVA